jgi:hypothetical protein
MRAFLNFPVIKYFSTCNNIFHILGWALEIHEGQKAAAYCPSLWNGECRTSIHQCKAYKKCQKVR